MKAIQDYFRKQDREPTDIELETIAQTWSEHCVHKTLKSAVEIEVQDETGQGDRLAQYGNLIRDTIFQSTMDLIARDKREFCLSVFKDNAGVIAFDETDAVCFKVETHNHPSAIEPYGGAADRASAAASATSSGTGPRRASRSRTRTSSASPIRMPFSIRNPQIGNPAISPKASIHPKRILQQVVAGVRDLRQPHGHPRR
jgi:phosphoribosylformylglycinamidine synthase